MYIADQGNNRIRKVTVSTYRISTIAGSSASAGYSGDGEVATSATLNGPTGVALDSSGNYDDIYNFLFLESINFWYSCVLQITCISLTLVIHASVWLVYQRI